MYRKIESVHVTHDLKKIRKKLPFTLSCVLGARDSVWQTARVRKIRAWHSRVRKAVRQAHTPLPACLERVLKDFLLSFSSENLILRDRI